VDKTKIVNAVAWVWFLPAQTVGILLFICGYVLAFLICVLDGDD